MNITNAIKNLLPSAFIKSARKVLLGKGEESDYVRPFYSQCGEDIILNTIMGEMGIKNGFFIDVGAFHPFAGSNTFLLSNAGWRGINIEPNPTKKKIFEENRKNDINLSIGISGTEGELNYYMLGENSSMNTFSKENLERFNMFHLVKETLSVKTYPLRHIIATYVPGKYSIDFLNIDAEGYEMEILHSIDWNYKTPQVIAIEQSNVLGMETLLQTNAYLFLKALGYIAYARTIVTKDVSTVFYVREILLDK